MTESEVLAASQQRLIAWADFLGLRPVGKRGTYWVRKSARHPITKRDYVIKHSTKTADLRTAILRAQPVVQKFLAGVQTRLVPMVSTRGDDYATVGECLKAYVAWEHGGARTRRQNANSLRAFLEGIHPEVEDVDGMSVEAVDDRLARMWLDLRQSEAAKIHLPHDRDGFERRKRGLNQKLANAQSVFSRRSLQRLRDLGLRVPPTVTGFVSELGLEARPAPPPEDFTQDELAAIRAGLPALKERSPAVYAALMLQLHAGLRNGEIVQARWSWFGALGDSVFIDLSTQGSFEPKGRDGWVEISADLVPLLPCRDYPPAPDDYVIMADTDNERRDTCYRAVNDYLRSCGIEKKNGKIAYRARGHAITQIYLAHGAGAAKEFARHSTQRTTDRYYKGAKVPYTPLAVHG